MTRYYKILTLVFFIAAVSLRLLLYWSNPSSNSFDNHFEPIFWIMKYGTIPPKDALWQSYQPPVFYVLSAFIGNLATNIGVSTQYLPKILQFIPCLYGILTIGVIYLILKKLPLSEFSRLLAFGLVCFLPRHIYLSAMHSNDTIAGLSVAICVYLMLTVLERKFSPLTVIILSISIVIALFTKYTSFVVIPMALSIFIPVLFQRIIIPRKILINACLFLIIVPLFFLCTYFYSNIKHYHRLLPWNDAILTPAETQPRAEGGLTFASFKPWEHIRTPILAPWNIDSFWTLIYSRMWFDVEPKFLFFTDQNISWWNSYYQWLRGERTFPSDIALSPLTSFTASVLITLGLVPLLFIIIGVYRSIFGEFSIWNKLKNDETITSPVFLILFLCNAAGIIALALKSPVYSSVKATYFIGSLPAFSVFLGFGIMACERHKPARWILSFVFGSLFVLTTLHIIHIVYSLGFKLMI